MAHATMVLRVLSNSNGRLIVKPEWSSTRWRIAQFRCKIPKPDTIRASIICSNVLCLSSRLSYYSLPFTAPVHQALSNKDGVATSGACRVNITRIVRIRIDLELCAVLSRAIAEAEVPGASQVL